MKKVKIMLASVAIMAIVAGSLAFNVKNTGKFVFTLNTDNGVCEPLSTVQKYFTTLTTTTGTPVTNATTEAISATVPAVCTASFNIIPE